LNSKALTSRENVAESVEQQTVKTSKMFGDESCGLVEIIVMNDEDAENETEDYSDIEVFHCDAEIGGSTSSLRDREQERVRPDSHFILVAGDDRLWIEEHKAEKRGR
jgi:hypothetical protein